MEAGFSQIWSHIIINISNPKLNHYTYFTIFLNESAITPEHFGLNQGKCIVFFMHNIISRPCDPHNIIHMWPNLRKASFHAHNSKTHFSPSNNGCIHSLTIKPGIDAESCPGCFWCGLFLWLVGHPRVLRSPLNGSISPWQADSRLYFIT